MQDRKQKPAAREKFFPTTSHTENKQTHQRKQSRVVHNRTNPLW
jgi:hypothetical protein